MSSSARRLFTKKQIVSKSAVIWEGGGMCLEILSLSASSFPEHLYVFVVLMNGTKVSGGPVEGGSGLKWGPLSGQSL